MKRDKYYTPEIEEFYVGFEYECNNDPRINDGWVKEIVCEISTLKYFNGEYQDFRVKYLDKEDIESLGFIKSKKDNWIGWFDYHLEDINPEYGYYLQASLHVPRTETWGEQFHPYKIILHRYYDPEDSAIDKYISDSESEIVYVGTIKNKSELKKLLSQLKINVK